MKPVVFLQIPRAIRDAIIEQARAEFPRECCGILGGKGIRVQSIHPLRNVHSQPETRFLSDSKDLLGASKSLRQANHDWLAIYHSHPKSPPVPSRSDLNLHAYGYNTLCLIASLQVPDQPEIRVWRLAEDRFWELPWGLEP